jgi:hypothetical protein
MNDVPRTQSKIFNPALIWSILVTMVGGLLLGVTFGFSLQSAIAGNASEIIHVKELQSQTNEQTKESLERLEKQTNEIKRMLQRALSDRAD